MKKLSVILALLILATCLTACTNATQKVNSEDHAVVIRENERIVSSDAKLLKRGGELYSFVDVRQGRMIYVTELESGESMPLCGRPECMHDDENCNAFFDGGRFGTAIYGNRIYWVNLGIADFFLNSMAINGTDRRVDKQLKKEYEQTVIGNGAFFCFYKDRFYRFGTGGAVEDGEIFERTLLYSQALAEDSEPEEILNIRVDEYCSSRARIHENMIYMAIFSSDNIDIISYDMDTGTLTELYSGSNGPDVLGALDIFVRGDELIFHCGASRIVSYSLKDGSFTDIYPNNEDFSVWVVSDEHGININSFGEDYVCYDASGKTVASGLLTEAGLPEGCLREPLGSIDGVFYFFMESDTGVTPDYNYLVSIDPKTGEAKILLKAEMKGAMNQGTLTIQ